MNSKTSSTSAVVRSLSTSRGLTAKQISKRLGLKNESAVRGKINALRNDGYPIYENRTKNGSSFRIGSPSRGMVAAAAQAGYFAQAATR